jgi:hypothetical protein
MFAAVTYLGTVGIGSVTIAPPGAASDPVVVRPR